MKKNRNSTPYVGQMSPEQVADMVRHGLSGAAGIHADQKTRRNGTFRTNRTNTRSAARREAIRQSY